MQSDNQPRLQLLLLLLLLLLQLEAEIVSLPRPVRPVRPLLPFHSLPSKFRRLFQICCKGLRNQFDLPGAGHGWDATLTATPLDAQWGKEGKEKGGCGGHEREKGNLGNG